MPFVRILHKWQGSLGIFHLALLSVEDTKDKQANNYIQKKETRMRLLVSPQGLEPWTH